MKDYLKFYIDGGWVEPSKPETLEVIDPATEQICARISVGSAEDVDRAVKAARRAFDSYAQTSFGEREELLNSITEVYKKRFDDIAHRHAIRSLPQILDRQILQLDRSLCPAS